MRTGDPFLRHWWAITDRFAVWCVLAFALAGVTWTAAYERGFGIPAADAWRTALAVLAGHRIDREAATLLALSATVGALAATVIGAQLFRIWKRQARPAAPLRGTRWEDEA